MSKFITIWVRYSLQALKLLVKAPYLALLEVKNVSSTSELLGIAIGRSRPKPGEVVLEDLVPGSTWRTIWGDEFIVKTKNEIRKEYHDPNTNLIYIYTTSDPAFSKNSKWPYKFHIPKKVKKDLLKVLVCMTNEKEYKELSKKGGQHDQKI